MQRDKSVLLLIGHGGVPSDFPRDELQELKRLESARRARGLQPSQRERELDARIRTWPRTSSNDPYVGGLERLRLALAELAKRPVFSAYNEFCAPAIGDAIDTLVEQGTTHIHVLSTMVTSGGSHSEVEIPEELASARRRYDNLRIDYVWPIDPLRVAQMLLAQLEHQAASMPLAP